MRVCPKCHSQVDDECIFCSECGSPMPKEPQTAPQAEPSTTYHEPKPEATYGYTPPSAPAPKKKSRKGLIALFISLGVLVVAGAVVAVLFLTGVFDFGGSGSTSIDEDAPEVASDYSDARYSDCDAEALVACIPQEAWEAILEKRGLSEEEALEYLQTWLDGVKEGGELELQGIETEELSDDDFEDLKEQMADYLEEDISSAMTCIFTYSSEVDGEEVEISVEETFIEYDGKWYYNPNTLDSYLDGADGEGGSNGGTPGTYPGFGDNNSGNSGNSGDSGDFGDHEDSENNGNSGNEDPGPSPEVNSGYATGTEAINAYLKASVHDFDARAAVETMPAELVAAACEKQGMTKDQFIAQLQQSLDTSKNMIGSYEYTTTVTDVTEYTSSQMANYLKAYAGIFSGEITAINEYTVTVSLSLSGQTQSQNMTLIAAQYEGRWYVFGS